MTNGQSRWLAGACALLVTTGTACAKETARNDAAPESAAPASAAPASAAPAADSSVARTATAETRAARESGDKARGDGEHGKAEGSREGGEHAGGREGEESRKRGAEQGGEEESGVRIARAATWDATRRGARLVLSFDSASSAFTGRVENTSAATLCAVRVEVHLTNGPELGPTQRTDVRAGESVPVRLPTTNASFSTWTAHPEVSACPRQ